MSVAPKHATGLLAAFQDCPVLGIVRAANATDAGRHLDRIVAAGVGAVEISLATPDALDAVTAAVTRHGGTASSHRKVLVGVGTVMTVDDLHGAADAGAGFAVTPTTRPDVLAAANQRELPIVSGAATPTEVQLADAGGAAAIKLFPASLWSVAAFRDLLTVFSEVSFVPTGGIGADEAANWLRAGAAAVGLGSALTSRPAHAASLVHQLRKPAA